MVLLTTVMTASAGVGFAADAAATWAQNCASCHGKDGSGSTMMGRKLGVKDYREPKVQASFSDAEMQRAIKEGVKTAGKETTKPFGSKLSEADIKALVELHTSAPSRNSILSRGVLRRGDALCRFLEMGSSSCSACCKGTSGISRHEVVC